MSNIDHRIAQVQVVEAVPPPQGLRIVTTSAPADNTVWQQVRDTALDVARRERVGLVVVGPEAQTSERHAQAAEPVGAAGATGGWEWDIPSDTLRGDARFAILTGLDPLELEAGAATAGRVCGLNR